MALAIPLSQMKDDINAFTVDFFAAYANDQRDEEQREQLIATGNVFIKEHVRTRLGQLFRLTIGQAEAACVKGGVSKEEAPGWRGAIEDAAGMSFREQSVPSSAFLATAAGAETEYATKGPLVKFGKVRKPRLHKSLLTVGAQMALDGSPPYIPEYCYDVIQTENPEMQTITEPELIAFTDRIIEYYGTVYGRFNLGRPLCRLLGKLAEKRLPKIPLGKGKNRAFRKILDIKTKNRKHVSWLAHATLPLPATLSAHVTLLNTHMRAPPWHARRKFTRSHSNSSAQR